MENQRLKIVVRRMLVAFTLTVLPRVVLACPVCYADPNSPTSNALVYAIVALLGVTGTVLTGVVAFFVRMQRRSKITLNGTVDLPSLN